jgi:hypothetical protein
MLCASDASYIFYNSLNDYLDCGDITDVAANNGVFGAETECTTPCPGDPIHLCGGGNRLTTYYWNGSLNVWHTPTNAGRYEVSLFHVQSCMYVFADLNFS